MKSSEHIYEAGDVCYISYGGRDGKVLLIQADQYAVTYIWADGIACSVFKQNFDRIAKFIYHSDDFIKFMRGGFA